MIIQIACPLCAHKMNYESRTGIIKGRYKQCVFCGNKVNVDRYLQKRIN
ncbi:hypothetical protein JXM83_07480 [Candidatus Woesearchaeota archaeon]|nr:hypothetical protein [Candidatus Woesearchaeota archaeon]